METTENHAHYLPFQYVKDQAEDLQSNDRYSSILHITLNVHVPCLLWQYFTVCLNSYCIYTYVVLDECPKSSTFLYVYIYKLSEQFIHFTDYIFGGKTTWGELPSYGISKKMSIYQATQNASRTWLNRTPF